ncbi:MAG TPA: hypothetical protein VMV84_01075 [Dehalococcoidales bacterium]|nr:hypothetical protein [Dehalococcoidales bacterium]
MSKGLSKQQRKILAILRIKQAPRDPTKGAFTTDEVISELSWEYKMWLVSDGPMFNPGHPRARGALRPHETLRISVHRALQSLERRGLIVSYMARGARCWALLERLTDWEKRRLTYSAEDHERRRVLWQWGWWVRRLPLELKLAYKLGIGTPEQREEVKRQAEEWAKTHLT